MQNFTSVKGYVKYPNSQFLFLFKQAAWFWILIFPAQMNLITV